LQTAARLSQGVIDLGISYVLSFKIFDVITGAIAKVAGVKLKTLPGLYPWLPVDDVCLRRMFALHGIKPITNVPLFLAYRNRCCAEVWNGLNANKKCPFNGTIP
jgi:hypothetical protein